MVFSLPASAKPGVRECAGCVAKARAQGAARTFESELPANSLPGLLYACAQAPASADVEGKGFQRAVSIIMLLFKFPKSLFGATSSPGPTDSPELTLPSHGVLCKPTRAPSLHRVWTVCQSGSLVADCSIHSSWFMQGRNLMKGSW